MTAIYDGPLPKICRRNIKGLEISGIQWIKKHTRSQVMFHSLVATQNLISSSFFGVRLRLFILLSIFFFSPTDLHNCTCAPPCILFFLFVWWGGICFNGSAGHFGTCHQCESLYCISTNFLNYTGTLTSTKGRQAAKTKKKNKRIINISKPKQTSSR